jgi:hypothetical protein
MILSWVEKGILCLRNYRNVFYPKFQYDAGNTGELPLNLVSKVDNNAIPLRGYLTLKTQKYVYVKTGENIPVKQFALAPGMGKPSLGTSKWVWQDVSTLLNKKLIALNVNSFYSFVNDFYNFDVSFNSSGKYRVYAVLTKPDGSVFKDKYGRALEKTYEFDILDKKLYECSDETPWFKCSVHNSWNFCEYGDLIPAGGTCEGFLCRDSSCKIPVCVDSDNGEDYASYGYVTGYYLSGEQGVTGFYNKSDFCPNVATLREFICKNDSSFYEQRDVYCSCKKGLCVDAPCVPANCDEKQCGSDGCWGSCGTCNSTSTCNSSGQCVSNPSSQICTDSDGGQVYTIKGNTTNSSKTFTDFCFTSVILNEGYCSGSNVLNSSYNCLSGQTCTNGVCVNQTNTSSFSSKSINLE